MGRRVSETKKCKRCGEAKPRADFTRVTGLPNAVQSYCKACNAEVARERRARRHPSHQAAINRRSKLKRNYGLTLEQYEQMRSAQGGLCAICGTGDPGGRGGHVGSFVVDHCHDTGKIRGLLCHACNTGIGSLRDSVEVLASAIGYLSRSREE